MGRSPCIGPNAEGGRLRREMAAERPDGTDPIADGWAALGEGPWLRARSHFEYALAGQEAAEALEGLGWAGYCLDDEALTFDARERAYRFYREAGKDRSAARVAAWLASDCLEFQLAALSAETRRRTTMTIDTKPATSAEEVVESLCQAYASAVNASDSEAYSKLFAQDAVRMPPGRPLEYGPEQIRAGEQADYEVARLEVTSTPGDALQAADDWIYAIAHIEGSAKAHADGAKSTFRATKTWLLQRQDSGEWLIARQMWNLKPKAAGSQTPARRTTGRPPRATRA